MDDSSGTSQEGQQEGSWLRRRLGTQKRAQRETGVPAGTQPIEGAPLKSGSSPRTSQESAIWTDSHCHLQDEPDPGAVVAAARAARVGRVVCVGTDEASSRRAVLLANELSGGPGPGRSPAYAQSPGSGAAEVWATVGLHPHDAKSGLSSVVDLLDELVAGDGLRRSRVVAIGECGLDYHYDNSPREVQRDVFAAQIGLANQHDLTLVIHTREAWDDTFSILEHEGVPSRTIFHCFTGGEEEAKQCLSVGGFLSFSGIVTFASAEELRRVVVDCPLDSLLVETDSPFLTPVPHRGRRNSPANIALVGEAIGRLKGFEPEVLAALSWMNADKAFGLGA